MKRIITALILLVLSISVSIFEIIYIPAKVDYFTDKITDTDELIESGDYESAEEALDNLSEEWLGSTKIADIFLYHDYVDDISADILAMRAYAKSGSGSEYSAQSEIAKQRLASLKESELVKLENIF